MKISIKSYFALAVLIIIGILMIVNISKEAQSINLPMHANTVDLLDLNQVLSYSISMPAEASDRTFDMSKQQTL